MNWWFLSLKSFLIFNILFPLNIRWRILIEINFLFNLQISFLIYHIVGVYAVELCSFAEWWSLSYCAYTQTGFSFFFSIAFHYLPFSVAAFAVDAHRLLFILFIFIHSQLTITSRPGDDASARREWMNDKRGTKVRNIFRRYWGIVRLMKENILRETRKKNSYEKFNKK